ncbi:hypothetical protein EMCRGX_G018576 [Ephydatia muelleri]
MSEELQTIDSDTGIVFSAFREAISDVPPSEAQLSLDTYYSLSDYTASDDTQLDLQQGEKVAVLEKVNSTWWWVEVSGRTGYVPANHLTTDNPISAQETDDIWQDGEYFSSYGSLKLHHEMLADRPRTETYRSAIQNARAFIKGKVVLDVGSGTGVLSMFCVRLGGAKKVYSVEASDMADHSKALVKHNCLSGEIEVIKARAEGAELPEKVDMIVSEWMGTLLMFEMMLEAVIISRDKWLKEDGVVWPSGARLFLVPCSAQQCYDEKISFWDNVYGFDFSPLKHVAQSDLFGRPIHNHVMSEGDCLSKPLCIHTLDTKTVTVANLELIQSNFRFEVTKSGIMHGFGSWFDVTFGSIPEGYKYSPVVLSTSPRYPLTHWKQALLMLNTPLHVTKGDHIEGDITLTRNKVWRRHLRLRLKYKHSGVGVCSEEMSKEFLLWR